MSGLAHRWEAIQDKLSRKANHPVTVVAVTKKQPLSKIQEAVALGLRHFGNNYAQEGEFLQNSLSVSDKVVWHFIGHIQSRKAKELFPYQWIQSLDREKVADLLEGEASKKGKHFETLIEVNIGGEEQKSGIDLADLDRWISQGHRWPHLRLRGLMAMPPPLDPPEARRPFFKRLRETFERYKNREGWDTLSMGTSDDYEIAVEEGANMVRLGTCLFGPRA
jgi:pyridoxal phosphate enzyme (YggS family)